jgi:molybdopterin-guanine dinucleotide biosynthesis protein A
MAGGKSSRMGTDKAFVPFLGRPMIEHVIERVQTLGSELTIITNNPDAYTYLGYPLSGDIYEESGPLGGLHSALYHAKQFHVLVVACDMPWLNISLLEHMISLRENADVVVPRWVRFPEPLHAIYNKNCLAPIEENLERELLKVIGFYGRVEVRFLDRSEIIQFDPDGRSFSNVNTPEDLSDASSAPDAGSS